jgi:hypothetical protein
MRVPRTPFCIALFSAPLHAKPREITQLESPCDGVRGNNKMVIENRSLIHLFLVLT